MNVRSKNVEGPLFAGLMALVLALQCSNIVLVTLLGLGCITLLAIPICILLQPCKRLHGTRLPVAALAAILIFSSVQIGAYRAVWPALTAYHNAPKTAGDEQIAGVNSAILLRRDRALRNAGYAPIFQHWWISQANASTWGLYTYAPWIAHS